MSLDDYLINVRAEKLQAPKASTFNKLFKNSETLKDAIKPTYALVSLSSQFDPDTDGDGSGLVRIPWDTVIKDDDGLLDNEFLRVPSSSKLIRLTCQLKINQTNGENAYNIKMGPDAINNIFRVNWALTSAGTPSSYKHRYTNFDTGWFPNLGYEKFDVMLNWLLDVDTPVIDYQNYTWFQLWAI